MKKFLLLSVAVFSIFSTWAQQRTCGTMAHEQQLMLSDPHYSAHRQDIDRFAQSFQMSHNGQRTVITIPVVVHVIYHDSAGNISMAQIQSQIDRLNLDYHKSNPDTASVPAPWKSRVADCNIQFCLAQRTPTGAATNGVVRKRINTATSWTTDDKVKYTSQGGDDAWPASSYLNLWVCDLGNSLLGYAQFPGGTAATDGVVILNTAFGSVGSATGAPYNKGRTATHEVGHWLNLYHIWGDDNGACTGTDQVGDTPNQGNMHYGCPPFPSVSCSNGPDGDMFMNYMDYTDDACMYMFTNGQNTRIQANFATGGARASLLNSQGCVPPSGGPVTAFTANKTTICVGQSINFTDQTTGSPTAWSWSFPGAATTTSTTQNPQNIVYNTAGTYSVTLTASNAGGSTPLTRTNYITVLGTTPLPLKEGFESTTFPPTGWSLGNPDAGTTWVRTTSASGFGQSTACAFMDNYNYNGAGQKDYLYSPVYSFTRGINATSKLKFDYAYALYNATSTDSFQVLISTDCGTTWTSLWKKGGTQLRTNGSSYTTSQFVPTATQWVRDSTVSLASYAGMTSVQFAFVNINKYGQSLLLDNINIDTVASTGGCTRPVASFVASPTTVTQGSTVSYTDQSTNSPTAWAWTFGGGTPAASTVQAPGAITYSTVGTYTTKLRVTNACGSDSTTVTITVVPASTQSGCDTLSHLLANDSLRVYGDGNSTWGVIAGTNSYHDLAKAEKYTNINGRPINSVLLGFVYARSAGTTDSVTINIWDANGTNGLPGTVLGTAKVAMSTVMTNVANGRFTQASFSCPVATNSTFYVGFNINYLAGDTIWMGTTSYFNNANHAYQGYELNYINATTSQWAAVDSDWFPFSYYIFPVQCTQTAPTAAFTANRTSLCIGDSVRFTDQSTGCPTGWSWQVTGPVNMVSSVKNPTFTFTTAGTYSVTLTASNAGGNNAHTQTSYITVRPAPTASMSSVAVSCYGGSTGSATVTASGGTSYTYLWSPGGATTATISNKPAGNYTVTVTSNYGCSSTASITISQPFSALSASTSATSAYCGNSNGSVSVTASGGNGGFTYSWSPGSYTTSSVSNLAAGTYTVTVRDSKSCSVTSSVAVTSQTATVTISFSNTNSTCGQANGSIVATINGSSNGAHYHWSNGDTTGSITNVAAGIYTVTITNALGCSASKADTLRSTAGATVTTSTTPVSCNGGNNGTATATATGTGSFTYAWSGGGSTATISNKTAGTYTVTVTDGNGCQTTATATIAQPAVLTASATSTAVICTTAGTATVTGSGGNAGAYTYLWSNTQTTATATNLSAATYTVTVKDTKLCSATASVTVANQSATLSVSLSKTDATCGNSNGSVTASTTATGVTYTWAPGGSHATSMSNVAAGTYSVTITNTNGCSASASIIVQNSNGANVTTSSVPVTCFGNTNGSATVTATGGSGTYTYSWAPGGATTATITGKAAGTYTVTVSDGTACPATASVVIGGPSAALSASVSSTPVICTTAGTATATGAGGNTGGYTYLWSNTQTTATATGLTAGTYTVTVKDSRQCSAVTSVAVTNQVSTLTVSVSKTDASCGGNNGTAAATTTATGVTYVWSPGGATSSTLSNLAAGTYAVTITDANGCSASASATVGTTTGLSASITAHTDATCHGGADGAATVAATGGTGSYTYLWSNGTGIAQATGLTAATYTVTVSNSGCSATATVSISEPTSVSVTTSSSPVICTTQGTATASGSGGSGSGYTYLWSTTQTTQTITGLAVGSYTVTVKDGHNCSAVATASITQQASTLTDSVHSTPSTTATSNNGTATAYPVGGAPNYTYVWNNNQTTQTATQLAPGTYTCTITDMFGCLNIATVTVGIGPNAIVDLGNNLQFTIAPNPTTDKCVVTVEMNEPQTVELALSSLLGQQVWIRDLGFTRSISEQLDLHELAGGIYILKLKAGDTTYSVRLVKE
ncbi:MAG: PKD domain-containing protein [Bacteroidetes bacterium]|nr:PKD domain-containing protein [Bacteroidota bacterium]